LADADFALATGSRAWRCPPRGSAARPRASRATAAYAARARASRGIW